MSERGPGGIVRAARRPPGWIAPGPAPAGARGRPELEPAADEDLCYLAGDWRLFQKQRGHRWSLDDLVTAWIATRTCDPTSRWRALDLGCGLGSVLLMVAWRLPRADVTGVEAQADRAAMGRRSIAWNGVEDRCRIVDGDLRDGVGAAAVASGAGDATGGFDVITGTPPYFPRGTGTEPVHAHAAPCRFELRGGVEDYLATAAAALAPGGWITVCTSTLERDRVEAGAAASGLARREHWEIVPREGKAALVAVDVLTAGDGAPAAPSTHTLVVRDRAGAWTPAFREVREALGMPSRPPR
jgi:tRNA1Val (adenine37-N6)-methyltransferase